MNRFFSVFSHKNPQLVDNVSIRQQKLILLAIISLGLTIRAASWWLQGFRGSEQSEFETMSRFIAQGDWSAYFSMTRPHQPVYAFLLMPKYLFNVNLGLHTFILHSVLASGTIYLVFRIAQYLFGTVCGLLSALLVAINLMIALWFPWITGDTPFHFFLALFALSSVKVWEKHHLGNILSFFFCGLLCILSRPEGLFVAAMACMVLIYMILYRFVPVRKILILMLAAIILGKTAFVATLYYNKPVRDAFFSSMHVAFPLYISTRMSTNSPQEQAAAYNSMGIAVEKARHLPGFVSPNYALSMEGLRFIQENPLTWFKMYTMRLSSIVFPSVFSPWWSLKTTVYSFSMSFLLFFGSLIGCYLGDTKKYQVVGLTLMGFTIALVVSLFQREMDHRVPLSMDIILSCVAPYGWIRLYQYLMKRGPYA